jgi:hypothetical protein
LRCRCRCARRNLKEPEPFHCLKRIRLLVPKVTGRTPRGSHTVLSVIAVLATWAFPSCAASPQTLFDKRVPLPNRLVVPSRSAPKKMTPPRGGSASAARSRHCQRLCNLLVTGLSRVKGK